MYSRKVMRLVNMEALFLREFRPYENISWGFLREFFTKELGRMYPRLVKQFYYKVKFEGSTLRTSVKGIKVFIHIEDFGDMFKLPYYGETYIVEGPTKLNNFSIRVDMLSFMVDPMREQKFPLKTGFMKDEVCMSHHLLTSILFPIQGNLEVFIKEDLVVLWFITQHHQANLVDGMFSYITVWKKNHLAGFPYGSLITKILASTDVDLMDELVDAAHSHINLPYLSKIKFWVFNGELRNDPMEKDEDEAYPISINGELINTIITMTQQTNISIKKLTKDDEIIKKNTSGKSIINNDDNSDNK